MNPPTIGHQKLVDKINSEAKKLRATPELYLSHSQDRKKNPLSYDKKIKYATAAFGRMVKKSKARTLIEVLKDLDRKYTHVVVIAGSDRVEEFQNLTSRYNGKEYSFTSIEVISAGERDPDADDVSGMSASKLRKLAAEGNIAKFMTGIPTKLQDTTEAMQMYDDIRTEMGISEDMSIEEALTVQQRLKRRAIAKRIKSKLKLGRRRAKFKMANKEKLTTRSRKKARQLLRNRLAGSLGQQYKELPFAAKQQVDKKLDKKKALIGRLARRLLPKVKKAEMERLAQVRQQKNEEYMTATMEAFNRLELEQISEKVEKNLTKKSQKYGVKIESLKQHYVRLKKEYQDEQLTFQHLNHDLAKLKEATYKGKKVTLNKPMAGDVKKSKVYVDPEGDGKAKKVEFGDPNMSIKKHIPARRKSFRARHNCDNPGPKDKARYWSCKAW